MELWFNFRYNRKYPGYSNGSAKSSAVTAYDNNTGAPGALINGPLGNWLHFAALLPVMKILV